MMHSYMAVHRESGEAERVLILVLMEDALAHGQVPRVMNREDGVLILVLMEDALAQSKMMCV